MKLAKATLLILKDQPDSLLAESIMFWTAVAMREASLGDTGYRTTISFIVHRLERMYADAQKEGR